MKKLLARWFEYTRDNAGRKADIDRLLMGTGYMAKRWWGWQHIPTEHVIIIYNRGER